MKMPRVLKVTLALMLSPILLEAAGNALPRISTYVTSGTLNTSSPICLEAMKKSALQAEFGASQEVVMDTNGKAGDFHADNKNGSMHFTARCNSVSKTWGMAISGRDANQTFATFKNVADLIQKQ